MKDKYFDVIIIGGGPAGMSTALILGRSQIRTLILNAENPRSNVTSYSHGFLTQDGKHPKEILTIAKKQLRKYPAVSYINDEAITLEAEINGYVIETTNTDYKAKRVVIATGYKDNVDEMGIVGLLEVYGVSVFPCVFCDGYELADKQLAVIGDPMIAPIFAKTVAHWSKDVVVFTNGEKVFIEDLKLDLRKNKIEVIETKIKEIHSLHGIMQSIELANGNLVERNGGFLPGTKSCERSNFAGDLGVSKVIDNQGKESYKVNNNKETDIRGLYIIGDARTGWSGIAPSVAEGYQVGKAIVKQIIDENWCRSS